MGKHTKFSNMDKDTLMRYLGVLTTIVETKISRTLPDTFSLIFDGWTHITTHYLGVLASWPSDTQGEYNFALLALSPLEDETSLSAAQHESFIRFVLSVYGRTSDNVICVIADNAGTNKAIAAALGTKFIGCASHRFNLAMKSILSSYEYLIGKVQLLMKKVRNLIPAAKLRSFTHLLSIVKHDIRWSSTHKMLLRYQQIREFILKLDLPDVNAFSLSHTEGTQVDSLVIRLTDLESVCKQLQKEKTTISDCRAMFGEVVKKYPETASYLTADAKIIADVNFESALVKVQRGLGNNLSELERLSVQGLIKHSEPASLDISTVGVTLAASALLKLRKETQEIQKVMYYDTNFLLPTSNHCERLNSVAGKVLGQHRNRISPETFEQQMFLSFNSRFWDISDVQHAVNGTEKASTVQVDSSD